jgi:hypothetical protein
LATTPSLIWRHKRLWPPQHGIRPHPSGANNFRARDGPPAHGHRGKRSLGIRHRSNSKIDTKLINCQEVVKNQQLENLVVKKHHIDFLVNTFI